MQAFKSSIVLDKSTSGVAQALVRKRTPFQVTFKSDNLISRIREFNAVPSHYCSFRLNSSLIIHTLLELTIDVKGLPVFFVVPNSSHDLIVFPAKPTR